MHRDYQHAQNADIEIRVDFSRPETSVDYRFIDDFTGDGWRASEFQSADVNGLGVYDVLHRVDAWLLGQ